MLDFHGAVAMHFHDSLTDILPRLRRHGLAMTRDRHAMEDLVQDTVVRALAARHSFKPGTNFDAWMHTILRNEFISGVRRPRIVVPLTDILEERASAPASQEDNLMLRDLLLEIDRLPATQRKAILLSTLSDLSYDQIAKVMKCRSGTVKSRISRGRDQLRSALMGEAVCDRTTTTRLENRRRLDGKPLRADSPSLSMI